MDDLSLGFGDTNPALADSVNMPVDGWDPSAVNPAATSWADVAKLGISRLVDATTRTPQLANTAPVLAQPAPVRYFTGAPAGTPGSLVGGLTATGVLVAAAIIAASYFLLKR